MAATATNCALVSMGISTVTDSPGRRRTSFSATRSAGKQRRVVSIVERLPVLQLINTHHRRQGGAFGIVIHAFPGAKIQMQGFHLGVKNGLGHGNGAVFHGLRQSAAG